MQAWHLKKSARQATHAIRARQAAHAIRARASEGYDEEIFNDETAQLIAVEQERRRALGVGADSDDEVPVDLKDMVFRMQFCDSDVFVVRLSLHVS